MKQPAAQVPIDFRLERVCHAWSMPRRVPHPGMIATIPATANLRTKIMDFRGFDSSNILIVRGGIPRPIGDFQEGLSQAILVGMILVWRLGVRHVSDMNQQPFVQ